MSKSQLSAGDVLVAKCTRCRQETNHTIVALVGETPAKIKCHTCGSEHKYRKPAAADKKSTAATPRARRTKAEPQAPEKQQWQNLQLNGTEKTLPYSMESRYRLMDLIEHPLFGIGQVQENSGTRKMTVLFVDGLKILRCG